MDTRQKARELKQECEQLLAGAEAEGRSLTAEEQSQYDSKCVELESALATIKRADQLAVVSAGLAEPATPSVGPVAATDPEQTRDSESVEVAVLKDRNAERGFNHIGEQLQAIAFASHPESRWENIDKRLLFLNERGGNPENTEIRQSGASESVASKGGFLVQKDFSDAIIQKTYSTGEIASRVNRIPIGEGSNGLTMNMIDESSRADGSRWGGVRSYWTGEAAALTSSDPTFAQQELKLNNLTALFYATEQVLSDATALESLVSEIMPQEIAFKVEQAIVSGSGSGQPLGYQNAACNVTQAKKSGQSATTIVADNVESMWSRLWAPSRANAVWLINVDTEQQLMAMVDAGSNSVYLPPLGLSDSPYQRLFNRPVIATEHAATLGTVGDIMLVDLGQYTLIDKGAVRSDSSISVRFLYNETTFRWLYRCDGQPAWNSALTPKNGSTTQSPFIDLATRS